jgi:hypothetical protein
MDFKTFPKAQDFLAATSAALGADEVRYSLILGIAKWVAANPHSYGAFDPWFCTVSSENVIRAPPRCGLHPT